MSDAEIAGFEIFPWNKNFETGLPLIDEQHRKLVRLTNQLTTHLMNKDAVEIERVFEELSAYADYHFKAEEKIWQPYFIDDPWFTNHLQTHDDFLTKISELRKEHATKPIYAVIEGIIKFLIHWLAFHILETDKRMAFVLQAVDSGLSLEEAKVHSDQEMFATSKVLISAVLTMYDTLSSRTMELMKEKVGRKKVENALRREKEAAIKANTAKSDFLASMSHELRTPLNAVLGFAQMLQFDQKNPLSPEQKKYTDTILAGGSHLLELIDDLLDLAKIEANQLELSLENVEAEEIVLECVEMISPLGEKRGIKIFNNFNSNEITLLRTDALRFKQSLINLLSNAVKYNKDGGSVSIDSQQTDGGFLRLSVVDTGVGIAKKNFKSIFQRFSRVGMDPMVAQEGTGIGLTVTKLLVEGMAGRIGFESEKGVGSTFWMELPLASNDDVLIWSDTLSVGVAAMDEDHQILIRMLNEIMRKDKNGVDVDAALGELMDFIHQHFRREEAIMEVCGDPNLEKHRALHRNLFAEINDAVKAWRKEHEPEAMHRLRETFKGLLFSDILNIDGDISYHTKGRDQDIKRVLEKLR